MQTASDVQWRHLEKKLTVSDSRGGFFEMKICLLPMDSRPCNYTFPGQLAAIYGQDEVVVPPMEIMDF